MTYSWTVFFQLFLCCTGGFIGSAITKKNNPSLYEEKIFFTWFTRYFCINGMGLLVMNLVFLYTGFTSKELIEKPTTMFIIALLTGLFILLIAFIVTKYNEYKRVPEEKIVVSLTYFDFYSLIFFSSCCGRLVFELTELITKF